METLLFGNYVFNESGLNYTFRSGLKWANKVKVGDWVVLRDSVPDTAMSRLRGFDYVAEIVEVHSYTRANDAMFSAYLAKEHDPQCRTLWGLVTEMFTIYGDGWEDKPMTVLGFVLKGRSMHKVA